METVLFVAVALLGSFVQTSCGLGFAVICVSFWSLMLPLETAVVLELLTGVVTMLYMAIRQWRHINWKLLLWPTVFSCSASLVGVFALFQLEMDVLYILLGLLLMALGVFFLFFSQRSSLHPTTATGVAVGLLGGFFGGLFGIAGPPVAAYLLAATSGKEEYSATVQAHFAMTSLFMILVHALSGNITVNVLLMGGTGILGVLAGLALGLLVYHKLSSQGLKKLVGAFLICMGLFYLLRNLF
ncbi:MAG TPA: sulfite exporter TauE/SafE family protein [Candidatus Galloscillospira stercoripullorum]|nr:sulfite exporter TauE/SafE family protein [Candidatus Galloscillospira stercoripullorum]